MNTAFLDALNLAWKIHAVEGGFADVPPGFFDAPPGPALDVGPAAAAGHPGATHDAASRVLTLSLTDDGRERELRFRRD